MPPAASASTATMAGGTQPGMPPPLSPEVGAMAASVVGVAVSLGVGPELVVATATAELDAAERVGFGSGLCEAVAEGAVAVALVSVVVAVVGVVVGVAPVVAARVEGVFEGCARSVLVGLGAVDADRVAVAQEEA